MKATALISAVLLMVCAAPVLQADNQSSGDKVQLRLNLKKGSYRDFKYEMDATTNVLEASARSGVRRVVLASSIHVMIGYNHDSATRVVSADSPIRPWKGVRFPWFRRRETVPYAATKLFGERLGRFYAESHDLSVIAVRLGRVYPPRKLSNWFRRFRSWFFIGLGRRTVGFLFLGWLSG